ncbi:hypothetical protein C8F01DRAFT_1231273 [Mycena amicta]|nr:hypothetical protein C8F01DRAFT_1231273 [Mycena amicta]
MYVAESSSPWLADVLVHLRGEYAAQDCTKDHIISDAIWPSSRTGGLESWLRIVALDESWHNAVHILVFLLVSTGIRPDDPRTPKVHPRLISRWAGAALGFHGRATRVETERNLTSDLNRFPLAALRDATKQTDLRLCCPRGARTRIDFWLVDSSYPFDVWRTPIDVEFRNSLSLEGPSGVGRTRPLGPGWRVEAEELGGRHGLKALRLGSRKCRGGQAWEDVARDCAGRDKDEIWDGDSWWE